MEQHSRKSYKTRSQTIPFKIQSFVVELNLVTKSYYSIILNNISNQKIKSSLYSPYYAEACNELRGPSPRLSAWATQLRRNAATVASRWRHCADLTGPGIEPQTSRTDSVRLATELTYLLNCNLVTIICRIPCFDH